MKISTHFTALGIKLVGTIFFISSLVDFIFLAIPLELGNRNWQINFTNSIVDRGVVPLLGIILLILGWWMTDNTINAGKPKTIFRLPVFILSSILGLLFLLLVPLHLSNVSNVSSQLIAQIDQRAGEQEVEIQAFIEQLDGISRNPQQIQQEINQRNQIIDNDGVIQGRRLSPQELQSITAQRDQLQQLLDLSQNPQELEERLGDTRNRLQTELRNLQRQEKQRAQTEALKVTLRTGISSFILSIGYIVLGWLGLKGSATKPSVTPEQ